MTLQLRSRLSPQGRTSGDFARRLIRHHTPLALASGVVLLLFMTVPPFDANRYPHVDIFSASFPKQRELRQSERMDHAAGRPNCPRGTVLRRDTLLRQAMPLRPAMARAHPRGRDGIPTKPETALS